MSHEHPLVNERAPLEDLPLRRLRYFQASHRRTISSLLQCQLTGIFARTLRVLAYVSPFRVRRISDQKNELRWGKVYSRCPCALRWCSSKRSMVDALASSE